MSEDNIEAESLCCASCGIAEVDEVKLKECADCDLARYCSDECKQDHKSQHEEDCKKRAAELRDEMLFKQPESSHLGDCPICCLPMPIDLSKSTLKTCCSKVICIGCDLAYRRRELLDEGRRETKCPFCRKPTHETDEESDKRTMKRIEANDPVATRHEGYLRYKRGDYISAFRYFAKAAELGELEAHYKLSLMYRNGRGVEKDEKREIYHLEEATIGGHPDARHSLGFHELNNDNEERAVKHFTIAATQGDDDSIKMLMEIFKVGFVSKENLAAALRAHQAAVDATKSPQRDAAEEFYRFVDNSNTEDC